MEIVPFGLPGKFVQKGVTVHQAYLYFGTKFHLSIGFSSNDGPYVRLMDADSSSAFSRASLKRFRSVG